MRNQLSALILFGILMITVSILISGCSSEKPKTLEELMIAPENETYEAALRRQEAIRNFPKTSEERQALVLYEFELQGYIAEKFYHGPHEESSFNWQRTGYIVLIFGSIIFYLRFKVFGNKK